MVVRCQKDYLVLRLPYGRGVSKTSTEMEDFFRNELYIADGLHILL
jgi:hypothetical protein